MQHHRAKESAQNQKMPLFVCDMSIPRRDNIGKEVILRTSNTPRVSTTIKSTPP